MINFIIFVFVTVILIILIMGKSNSFVSDEKVTPSPTVICPDDGVYNVPNPLNCSKYFMCFNKNVIPQFCPTNYAFSVEENRCLPVSDVDCQDRPYNSA